MTTIKDLVISFFETSKERLKNPAISAFILSWLAINWRIVLILVFSDTSIEERIDLIEECYFDQIFNLWAPLGFALFYLLILPYLMALFDRLSAWAITFRKSISHKHRIDDLSNRQEVAAEERQLELIKEGSPDVSKLKEELVILEKERDELLRELAGQKTAKPENTDSENDSSDDDPQEATDKKSSSRGKSKKRTPSKTSSDDTSKKINIPHSNEYPVMRDNVIKNIGKSEKEWILIYSFYAGNFGKKEFTRDDLIAMYEETKRGTSSRRANLSNNITRLVKQGFIRFLNENEMLLTDDGVSLAKEVLNR